MNDLLTDKKQLLFVLLVLLVLKFTVEPLYSWQDAQRAELTSLAAKQQKIKAILVNEQQFRTEYSALQAQTEKLAQHFAVVASVDDMKLQLQQRLQQAAELSLCRLELFDWVLEKPIEATFYQDARINVRCIGKAAAVIKLQQWVDSQPDLSVEQLTFGWPDFLTESVELTFSAELTVRYKVTNG